MHRSIINTVAGVVVTWLACAVTYSAGANSVGFDAEFYDPTPGQVSVTLIYDFTDFAMFGGGVDIVYDTSALEFVSYTQAPLPPDAQAQASPVGALVEPGLYSGPGIGTFEFFNGMTSAGDIGTFVFTIIGPVDPVSPFCGFPICIAPNAINPFVSLAGEDVTAELIANGQPSIGVPIPVPAGIWLMLSGLGVFCAQRRS